jgi:hypothetical protein
MLNRESESIEPRMSEETYARFMGFRKGPEKPFEERMSPKIGLQRRFINPGSLEWKIAVWGFASDDSARAEKARMDFCHEESVEEPALPKPKSIRVPRGSRRVEVYDRSKERFIQTNAWVISTSPWVGLSSSVKRMQETARLKEAISIEKVIHPETLAVCRFCHSMFPERAHCKLAGQDFGSLCSVYNKGKGKLVLPVQPVNVPYHQSLQYQLDRFERRNTPGTMWVKSSLPTFNRNDGKFLGMKYFLTNADGEPDYGSPLDPRNVKAEDIQSGEVTVIRMYRDTDPRLVPEKALEHSRTEDNSWFDDCAFPDDWKADMEVQEQDDHVYTDNDGERDVKHLSAIIQKPKYKTEYRRVPMLVGFRAHKQVMDYTRLAKVWKPNPAISECMWWFWAPKEKFVFTLEERKETVTIRHEYGIVRKVEVPTLIPVVSDSEETVLLNTSTVRTRREKQYSLDRSRQAKFRRQLTSWLIEKDALEARTGKSIPDPESVRKELAVIKGA